MRVKAIQADNTYLPNGTSTFARDHLEPISTGEATKRTMEIVDADYNKKPIRDV